VPDTLAIVTRNPLSRQTRKKPFDDFFRFQVQVPRAKYTTAAVILYRRRSFRFPPVRYRHGQQSSFDSGEPRSVLASPRISIDVSTSPLLLILLLLLLLGVDGWGISYFLRYTDLGPAIERARTWSGRIQGDDNILYDFSTKPTPNSQRTHMHKHILLLSAPNE